MYFSYVVQGTKNYFFRCRTDIRDEPAWAEPARPSPTWPRRSLTAYFRNLLKDTNLKLLHNLDTGLKFVVSNFHGDFCIDSEVIAFFAEIDFANFTYIFAYNSRNTNDFQNLIISRGRRFEDP